MGIALLRSEVNPKGEFNPRAFSVYGPKIVASRKFFDDPALESRCITEELGTRRLRSDIPINCPASLEEEARELRSKLLLYRFKTRNIEIDEVALQSFEPRLQQVFNPLYSVMESDDSRQALLLYLRKRQRMLGNDRSAGVEAQVLEIIFQIYNGESQIGITEITDAFSDRFSDDYGHAITPRWIGHIVRNALSLETQKSGGRYIIARSEIPKLKWLFEKYGLKSEKNLKD